ncbi:MAG TPA: ATPase, T2SS/T4P/T4SS family [Labilithrix sp.]|nr:ATPase, T2SS/T4P/T4SS family [Labilithrix sp.]
MNASVTPSIRASVCVRKGQDAKTYSLSVSGGVLTIGREPQCTIALKSGWASRQHVEIDLRGASMNVRDTSTNGTMVGDKPLKRSAVDVPFGTPVIIGEYTIVITRPSSASPKFEAAAAASNDHAPWENEDDARAKEVALRTEIHKKLLEHLDLSALQGQGIHDAALRSNVLAALREIVASLGDRVPAGVDRDVLVGVLVDEALGLGPLERFLSDPSVNEIMVVDPNTIYVEQRGKLTRADARFTNDDRVRAAIERIVTPLGRRIDESAPLVDARLSDGSRVNAVIRPLALRGSAITIRKFSRTPLTLEKLIELGAMNERMGKFLMRSVAAKKNIVIAGGTGSGKTTLLNALSGAIPSDERIVTIEDAAELKLKQPHVVSLETRPPNMEGHGEYTIRDLVKNALRMRPDRIVVGECRGGEALDMLQAMNTGHDGSLTTTHANSAREAVARLETLVLMAGLDLPVRAIREQIAGSVQLFVQQSRLSDGSRRVTAITEVTGIGEDGEIQLVPLFEYVRTGTGPKGKVIGDFRATGFLPTFLNDFVVMGLVADGEEYL